MVIGLLISIPIVVLDRFFGENIVLDWSLIIIVVLGVIFAGRTRKLQLQKG